ncbi:MAG: hypothetical protein WC716_15195 [Chitinophagaceae bacterium]|jgi:hypothetical protein
MSTPPIRQKINLIDGHSSGIDVKPLSGEQRAGVKLAYILLAIISVTILCLVACFYISDFDPSTYIAGSLKGSSNLSDSIYNRRFEEVKLMVQEKKEYRDFVTTNFQYIIGVLLPILTSILGYIFGTKAKE